MCQPCKLCDNSHYSVNCSTTTNSQCGLCHFGFYRTHPDEENCLPCKHVIPSYTYLCQEWLDTQKTTIPTNTGPPMDVSTEPVTTTKNTLVATPDRDALALSSKTDSSGYDPIVIIMTTIAVLIGLGVFTFIAVQCHKRGSLPCHKGTNSIPAEDKDRHDTDDPEAEQRDNKLINLEEIQTEEGEEEDTDALLSRTERPNGITPGASGTNKDEDRDGPEDDPQKSGSSSTASSTSSLDTENGDEAATAPKGQGDANDCSDPSSGTELLKGERRPKSPKKRASYGSYGSQKSRLSSQLSPSSSSSEGSINGTVEALPCKQNNATPYRAASPAVAGHPTFVKWSAPGGTAEVLLGETLLSNSHHQNAVGWMDVHKGSRPVVEMPDGRLVNQTARLPSDHESSTEAKMEMTDEIRNLFNRACNKCGDQGIKELSQDARDELANHLNPEPNREGVHSNWVHLADRFKVEGAKRDNLQEMKNLLQLLQTRNNCTIRELLQNVASIERFDALEAVCRVLLQDSENSLQDTSV
ncbi:PREDICTED: uncharacterized protein LOC109467858 [Branchiostoma belcheri]|uniref:Uncharacterized protein LOC109467858 n=1 Tax=Branchiostoma belcheri TaxID=7741 RepID=A0A6P4YSA2_BRABE|nr:PREDICTED: uncharacterized protein LOC109467858 [Branchiostoma belcheri]